MVLLFRVHNMLLLQALQSERLGLVVSRADLQNVGDEDVPPEILKTVQY